MKNRLISDQFREQALRTQGRPMNEHRASGRTTGLAIRLIGDAMCRPGERIPIIDHPDHGEVPAAIYMRPLIHAIADTLGLEFIATGIFPPGRRGKEALQGWVAYEVFGESK